MNGDSPSPTLQTKVWVDQQGDHDSIRNLFGILMTPATEVNILFHSRSCSWIYIHLLLCCLHFMRFFFVILRNFFFNFYFLNYLFTHKKTIGLFSFYQFARVLQQHKFTLYCEKYLQQREAGTAQIEQPAK